jgi:hypothetical protein
MVALMAMATRPLGDLSSHGPTYNTEAPRRIGPPTLFDACSFTDRETDEAPDFPGSTTLECCRPIAALLN